MDDQQVCTAWHLTNGNSVVTYLNADDLERMLKYAGDGTVIHLNMDAHKSTYINWSNVAYIEVIEP